MSKLGNQQENASVHNEPVTTNDIPDSQVPIEQSVVTINVFFDGTGNNQFNTRSTSTKSISYRNYYSNIALLEMACTEGEKVKKIYIQGSGTLAGKRDRLLGLGLGMGPTGAHTRVEEAFKEIQGIVNELNPYSIVLNVYGFSRGAFFARYFCAMAKANFIATSIDGDPSEGDITRSGRYQLKLANERISINLVGIYDTVSSHGLKHFNDVQPFHLDIGARQEIRKIVHLTAANDYRSKHFPLTRINTAAGQGVGFECKLPGAHSDIGGGYNDDAEDDNKYLSVYSDIDDDKRRRAGEISWTWYKEKGYYKGEPQRQAGSYGNFIVQRKSYRYQRETIYYYVVRANRKFESNSYQYITLDIMKTISEQEAQLDFTGGAGTRELVQNIASIEQEGGVLKKFRDFAYQYVMDRYQASGLDFQVLPDSILTVEERQELYHRYIHNSLDVLNTANNRSYNNGLIERVAINDMTGQVEEIVDDENIDLEITDDELYEEMVDGMELENE